MTTSSRIEKGMWWDKPLTLVSGCTEADFSCDHCWSRDITNRFHNNDHSMVRNNRWSGQVIPRTDKLKTNLPKRGVTYAVWNDLFHEKVPLQFALDSIEYMRRYPQHTFIVLTKRSDRMLRACLMLDERTIPKNVWLGVSVPAQSFMSRAQDLLHVPCSIRALSIEPMLAPIDLTDLLGLYRPDLRPAISWVICGCESGSQRRRPQLPWLENIVAACSDAGIPLFLKQWDFGNGLEHLPDFNGRKWADFPIPH
jgi:protein gp37